MSGFNVVGVVLVDVAEVLVEHIQHANSSGPVNDAKCLNFALDPQH